MEKVLLTDEEIIRIIKVNKELLRKGASTFVEGDIAKSQLNKILKILDKEMSTQKLEDGSGYRFLSITHWQTILKEAKE